MLMYFLLYFVGPYVSFLFYNKNKPIDKYFLVRTYLGVVFRLNFSHNRHSCKKCALSYISRVFTATNKYRNHFRVFVVSKYKFTKLKQNIM